MASADVCDRDHFSYMWIIENISELTFIDLVSPPFIEHSISRKVLYFHISEIADFRCYLQSENDFLLENCGIDIEISLLAADGSALITKRSYESELFVTLLTKDAFLERRTELIQKNTLTVHCRMWRRVGEVVTGFCHARTKLKTYRRSIMWDIDEFSSLHSTTVEELNALHYRIVADFYAMYGSIVEEFYFMHGSTVEKSREALNEIKAYYLESPTSEISSLALILYLKRNSESEDVYIDFLMTPLKDYVLNYEISVLDANGKVIESKIEGRLMSQIIEFRPLISKSKLMANTNLFLPNDTLLLKCSFEICFPDISRESIEYRTPNVCPVPRIHGVILNFYEYASKLEESELQENLSSGKYDNVDLPDLIVEDFSNEDDDNDDHSYDDGDDSSYDDEEEDSIGDYRTSDDCDDENFLSEKKRIMTNFCRDSCSLKSALKYLQNDTTMSDVSLLIGTKLFPAHKNILCCRSSVFQKILSNDVIKKTFEIEDIDENTLFRLYKYIYTDAVEYLQFSEAMDLYKTANDLQMLDLRNKCSDILGTILSEDNVCDLLTLAKKCQDEELEKTVQRKQKSFKRNNKWAYY